jgi:hypothetical protein
MNTRKKFAVGFTSIVLAGTLALGSVAAAAGGDGRGNDDGTGSDNGGRRHRSHLTSEQKCEYQEQIGARVAKVQQRIADRLVVLSDRRTEAEATGDTELVAQLDQRIGRLEKAQRRVDARYSTYQTWVTTNC